MGPDQHRVEESGAVPNGARPYVFHGTSDETAQTPGMVRKAAVSRDTVSEALWFGRVTCPPGLNSGPHHHAEAETAGFMLSGDRIRVYFGEDYEEFIEVAPGDFLYVPPWIPHIEVNMSHDTPGEFITARRPDNIVVNLGTDQAPR